MTTGRLEAFSDGVFAIAITLLVLEIDVPHVERELWDALGRQWPSYAAYVVSFATIGIIWVNHHAVFDGVARVNRTLLFLNLLLLLTVAFLPWPTALVAEYLREGHQEGVAAVVYSASLLLMGMTFFAVARYAERADHLRSQTLTPEQLRTGVVRNVVGLVGYALAIAVAPLAAGISFALCAAVAIYYVLPERVTPSPGPRG